MKKRLLIGASIVILLGVVIVSGLSLLGGQNNAEDTLRRENPLFHTVAEGGSCRPEIGDCADGLTCNEGKCEKY